MKKRVLSILLVAAMTARPQQKQVRREVVRSHLQSRPTL